LRDRDLVLPLHPLDAQDPGERTGFRLHRFELFNWGTFHNRVWGLDLGGDNTLLTGDIGSGKSTFVDAITTLLVPPHKVNYNKAAGAEERERTTRTYFLGQYKRERGETGLSARPVAWRDHNSYSVILGYFFNDALKQRVTLALVLWVKDTQGQPARLYVVADARLSISEHFAGFGTDISNLRKRLRGMATVETYDSFPPYGSAYRRRFGIEHEQALDLFNQTVSMKSVGNLTDFVRDHMLQPFAIEHRISALINHFEDLNRAHEAVVKAKEQIERLTPLVADCDERENLGAKVTSWRTARDVLHPWFSSRKQVLLEQRLSDLATELKKLVGSIDSLTETRDNYRSKRDDLKRDIAQNGGDRMERIKQEIAIALAEKGRREGRARQYDQFAHTAGLPAATVGEIFVQNQLLIQTDQGLLEATQAEKQNGLAEAMFEFRQRKDQHDELQAELQSLYQRRSNIPRHMLDLRTELCRNTGLAEDALPFAGELIQVREEESDWEGAIERLLHSFGLSILVSDAHYSLVAAWVDRTHLAGRLVYFRVRQEKLAAASLANSTSIVNKVNLKPDSIFYAWLESHLASRFQHVCCDTLDQFRREIFALTRAGQIKGRERHEKDDRLRIDDRGRFILGWSNEAKIAVLEKEARDLEIRRQASATSISNLQSEMKRLQARLDALKQLAVFTSFRDIDWKPLIVEIERLDRERRELEAGSDVLRLLEAQLTELEKNLAETERGLEKHKADKARSEDRQQQSQLLHAECGNLLATMPEEVKTQYFPQIEGMSVEALNGRQITIESCDARERELRDWLQTKIDAEDKKIARVGDQIVRAMEAYRNRYPLETQEVDASPEAAQEYRTMLHVLRSDDLPRFESRFKELLNENTIREVANFQSQLNRERETIRERIETINQSLREIDYNPGRYILLEAEPNADPDIRAFHDDLRKCTEGSLTGSEDEQYSEAKFLQVKQIIERFRGREGVTELDRRWTAKVTDVRYWFTFSASERWREDGREFEHYTDSGGKSGGQKEKLAYTVLAASLAYQFGLEWGMTRARSFRFVVIDEAFGRGSDESTRYGLELFGRLGLQLLIVTPLQKIHVIEPHVSSVGFVHIDDGRLSMLRNLTIEEYRAERAVRGA
jgi:uncharacterized protein YPO0396